MERACDQCADQIDDPPVTLHADLGVAFDDKEYGQAANPSNAVFVYRNTNADEAMDYRTKCKQLVSQRQWKVATDLKCCYRN